jgi:hypothetical protein
MTPRQEPAPLLPASLPPPLAFEAPTDTLTATAPARVTVPDTLPPPADDTRVPVTRKGTLYPELQLPRVVAKTTFQVPSKPPPALMAASTGAGTAAVERAANTGSHRKVDKLAKVGSPEIKRANWVIFVLSEVMREQIQRIRTSIRFRGSSLQIPGWSAISPAFIARLIKGCRVDVRAGYLISEIT